MAKGSGCFAVRPAMAAEMIFRCCQACLVGPGQAEEEMNDPSRRWTTRYVWEGQRKVSSPDRRAGIARLTFTTRRVSIREAAKYALRRHGILQEDVFSGVMNLVAPLPVRRKTAAFEML